MRSLAVALVTAAALLVVPVASGYVYWTDAVGVGRAGLDGSSPNEKLVAVSRPCQVAVNSSHIFWATKNAITASTLSGTGAHQVVNTNLGINHSCTFGLASTHLFWNYFLPRGCKLARVNTDGHGLRKGYINETPWCETSGFAASGKYLYYLQSVGTATNIRLAIVRVPLSGGHPHVLYHQKFNIGTEGIVVAGGHIYWDNANHIGRVNLNGTGAKPKFIRKPIAGDSGQSCGLAVAGGRLYWGDDSFRKNTEVFAVDSAKLDGSGINYNLLTSLKHAACVGAADGLGPPA